MLFSRSSFVVQHRISLCSFSVRSPLAVSPQAHGYSGNNERIPRSPRLRQARWCCGSLQCQDQISPLFQISTITRQPGSDLQNRVLREIQQAFFMCRFLQIFTTRVTQEQNSFTISPGGLHDIKTSPVTAVDLPQKQKRFDQIEQ